MYKKLFSTKENEKYLMREYIFLFNRLKSEIKFLLLINDNYLKKHIINIFKFYLKNYNCSLEITKDINNFIKLIANNNE